MDLRHISLDCLKKIKSCLKNYNYKIYIIYIIYINFYKYKNYILHNDTTIYRLFCVIY